MACFHHYIVLLFIMSFNLLEGARITKPQPLIFPIRKDSIKNQYYTEIDMGTPKSIIYAVFDLGGRITWFDCESGYTSSSYKPIQCDSKKCIQADAGGWCMGCNMPYRPGCTNNTCGTSHYNPYMDVTEVGGLGEDVMDGIYQTDGKFYLQSSSTPHYQFSCAHKSALEGLANGTKGIVGLARARTSLNEQLSLTFKLPHKFALCVPPSNDKGFGHLFIGGGPYFVPPYAIDVSKELITTPLITNPVISDRWGEYFIGVKSIKVDNNILTLNSTLLSTDKNGNGGTKLSTMTPYTILERSIYKAILNEFARKAVLKRMKKVVNVAPFGLCYRSTSVGNTMTGPDVPVIDLVLQSESVHWRIYGANSMVKVNDVTMCLGFIDGGLNPGASIVLGGHHLENNLVEFDLVSSKLGFTSSLLLKNTTCSQSRIF